MAQELFPGWKGQENLGCRGTESMYARHRRKFQSLTDMLEDFQVQMPERVGQGEREGL